MKTTRKIFRTCYLQLFQHRFLLWRLSLDMNKFKSTVSLLFLNLQNRWIVVIHIPMSGFFDYFEFQKFWRIFFFGRKTGFFKILIIKINCFTNVVTYVPKKRGTNSINLQNENKSDMYFLTLLILQFFISNTFERKAHL